LTFLARLISPAAADRGVVENPLRLVKIAVAGLLLLATLASLLLWASGIEPRALRLVGVCWALYGFVVGLVDGVLDPLVEGLGRALQDVGLRRAGTGYSEIESLAARGHYDAAAEAYRERAADPARRVDAMLRRASLLAGPLARPETAAAELESLRSGPDRLAPADDIRVGLALVDLWERRLGQPGRAMGELRRLIDRHPGSRELRRLRALLAELKHERFCVS